jgi:hypothetical protein
MKKHQDAQVLSQHGFNTTITKIFRFIENRCLLMTIENIINKKDYEYTN